MNGSWSAPALALLLAGSAAAQPIFVDRAGETGLSFTHFNGMTGRLYFAENMGSGAAFFDYDGDGDLDVYLLQGAMLEPGKDLGEAVFPPTPAMLPLSDRLFRNDLTRRADGRLEPRFVEVTAAAGLLESHYGMAVAVGDVDGDDLPDLWVGNLGADRLWHNDGDGSFSDSTAQAGISDGDWSAAGTFFDAEGDGDLDLYVANYVAWSPGLDKSCSSPASFADYCHPQAFAPAPDRLYRNRGDGRFEEVAQRAGVVDTTGRGLGAVALDVEGDGDFDLYVANDEGPNFLWTNRGDGHFEETALLSGCALSAAGQTEASMGIAVGDVDGDLDFDLLVANRSTEGHTLYRNEGEGLWSDASVESGIKAASLPFTGFGAQFLDYDADGRLDLFVANGEVQRIEAQLVAGAAYPLAQTHQLFRQEPGGRFRDVSRQAGDPFNHPEVGRGAAFGDVDQDGDPDILLAVNSGPARLLVNQVGDRTGWLAVDLGSAAGDTGSTVWLTSTTGRQLRRAASDGSYASASDERVLFGLGGGGKAERLEVRRQGKARWRLVRPGSGVYLVVRVPR